MIISVVIATYNGEEFLEDQLDSIFRQSRLPNEIIVSDDGSTDDTLRILKKFQLNKKIILKIVHNKSGRGITKNFNNAIIHSSGDLILLSDQDDIWLPNKVKFYEDFFQNNPKTLLMLSNAIIFKKNIKDNNQTKQDFFKYQRKSLNNFCTGCCMGFRKSFLNYSLPIPQEFIAHDVWLNHVGLLLGSRVVCDEVTMYYRRHSSNSSNHISSNFYKLNTLYELFYIWKRKKKKNVYQSSIDQLKILLKHFEKLYFCNPKLFSDYDDILEKIKLQLAEAIDRNYRINQKFLLRFRLSIKAYYEGKYITYSGLKSLIKDIFIP